jgi:urocanate hydratase
MQRDLQLDTMRLYRSLTHQRADWGGKLVLLSGPGCAQTGAPSAISIAGGTTLAIDSEAAAMKSAMRAGYLDFVVNSLDEALRALKNEVRQKRPLSVGLIADVAATRAAMDQRGIMPDLTFDPTKTPQSRDQYYFPAADAPELRAIDAALLATLAADDTPRRRWLQAAPQFLREARSGGRWIWLTKAELATLASQGITPAPSLSSAPTAP